MVSRLHSVSDRSVTSRAHVSVVSRIADATAITTDDGSVPEFITRIFTVSVYNGPRGQERENYMKHWYLWAVPVLLGSLGVLLFAAEKPPQDYQQAMRALGAFAQGISKAVEAEDYDAITKYATSAKDAFSVVEAYWSKKSDADALKAAQEGVKAAADLGVTANLKSKEGAEYSAKLIRDLCMGCHTAHREKAADGSFEIK
jgi:hypothetical protein